MQIEAQEHDPAHTLLQQCLPVHSGFQTPIGYKITFFSRPIILLLLHLVITFLPPLSFSILHDVKRTNERVNERTNGTLPFSRHAHLLLTITNIFAFCIVPLSSDTRSATTMTTAIGTTTMLMTTPPLLHVAQKGTFKIFKCKCKKHGETLAIFFRCTPIPL
jgi:hypothetical protein